MRVTLSAAVTADGYMDDDSPRRLIISTPGDWEEVYRLRAAHDAILAGAETLRRDDPSLLVRDQAARARRVQAGLKPTSPKSRSPARAAFRPACGSSPQAMPTAMCFRREK